MRVAIIIISTLVLGSFSGPALAGIKFYDHYISVLGSYDSNVERFYGDGAPRNTGSKGDVRMLFYGGLGLQFEGPKGFRFSLSAKPFYIKYQDFDGFNRGDVFISAKSRKTFRRGFVLDLTDKYRFTFFPYRSGKAQTYNSSRVGLSYSTSSKWKLGLQYRNLYRENPRQNLVEGRSHGLAFLLKFNPHPRVNLGFLLERDYEKVKFIFPNSVSGRRTWADLSARYFLSSYLLLIGKYMYQRDSMDFVFLPGDNIELMQEGGEEIADGILQSLRFLEDTHNNFRKHLMIFSALSKINTEILAEVFFLYQKKRLAEKVVEHAGLPQRLDRTMIAQGSLQIRTNAWSSFILYLRYERNRTNDPDHDYRFSTFGLGSVIDF